MIRVAAVALAAVALVALAPVGRAALFHSEEPFAVPVSAKGEPDALPFTTFLSRRADLVNAATPTFPLDDLNKGRTIRGRTKDRIERLQKLPNRTEREAVTLAVDLLRSNRANEAEEPLRAFRRGYVPNVTLAHIAAAQGEWERAYTLLDIATDDPPPKEFPGLSAQQIAWQAKLDRGPLKKFFQLRGAEARGPKRAIEDELPDRIFDVNFVNAAGVYEPGVLAPAEAAKLPPDAIAIVQQLVLWFPHDVRLYWLLGEVYAAKGEFGAADKILDDCARVLNYSNRKALMQHRQVVAKAAKAKGPAPDEPLLAPPDAATSQTTDEQPAPAVPFSLSAVWIYFGVVAAIALFALVRAVMKWKRNAPTGPAA